MHNTEQKQNGNGYVSKVWLLTLLIPAFAMVVWGFIMFMNSTLAERVGAVEVKQENLGADVSSIKSDVSFIKGFLQNKFGKP